MVVASRGCRVRGSHPGVDRRVRRVRGSHPVEDRQVRPVAVVRRGRAAVARRVRAAAVARPDRLGRIEPVETACTEVRVGNA